MIVNSMIALALLAAPQAASRAPEPRAGGGPHVKMTATGAYSDGTTRVIQGYLDVDSDADGIADVVYLHVTCDRGAIVSAIVSPRDSASGLPTGKRMHKPFTMTKHIEQAKTLPDYESWMSRLAGKPTIASWDLATGKSSREAATPSVSDRSLSPRDVSPTVCAVS